MIVLNMAANVSLEFISKFITFKHFMSPLVLTRQCARTAVANFHNNIGHKGSVNLFADGITCILATPIASIQCRSYSSIVGGIYQSHSKTKYLFHASLFGESKPVPPCCLVPTRNYGRKVRQKPQKISTFNYSGDLRNLPQLDKSTVLYKYQGLEDQLEGNEVLKKLSTLEFASAKENADHKRHLIKERIQELFGPDSQLEVKIAQLTLTIRQLIPYCIKYTTAKVQKMYLIKCINIRRSLLTNLRSLDHDRFEWLLRELKIRYVLPRDREEYKGWKHNLRVATQTEATNLQRKKLEELKAKFEAEKKLFYEHKAKVLSEIEADASKYGLSVSLLKQQILEDKEAIEKQKKLEYIEQLRARYLEKEKAKAAKKA